MKQLYLRKTAVPNQSDIESDLDQTAELGPNRRYLLYARPAGRPLLYRGKTADRDNDLTVFAGAAGMPAGEIVEFGGTLYDQNGRPIPNAVIEIWQTDAEGVYLHPNDPGTAQRDVNFQFYGEAVTDENGRYTFRTILPGEYEPRPRHIHFKVKLDGQELITSQFYFAGENSGQPDPLIITLNPWRRFRRERHPNRPAQHHPEFRAIKIARKFKGEREETAVSSPNL